MTNSSLLEAKIRSFGHVFYFSTRLTPLFVEAHPSYYVFLYTRYGTLNVARFITALTATLRESTHWASHEMGTLWSPVRATRLRVYGIWKPAKARYCLSS